jgi:hypothetical protein
MEFWIWPLTFWWMSPSVMYYEISQVLSFLLNVMLLAIKGEKESQMLMSSFYFLFSSSMFSQLFCAHIWFSCSSSKPPKSWRTACVIIISMIHHINPNNKVRNLLQAFHPRIDKLLGWFFNDDDATQVIWFESYLQVFCFHSCVLEFELQFVKATSQPSLML